MLSYRHAFHAGNFADVLKHAVLADMLAYMVLKNKPFDYIDTHAGAGLYRIRSPQAEKTGEYLEGFGRLQGDPLPGLENLFAAVEGVNKAGSMPLYPGSPALALHFLRNGDRAWLFELHSGDFPLLKRFCGKHKGVRIEQQDGLAGLQGLVPPVSRRALVLIDPSYEVAGEFEKVFEAVVKAYRKFSTGTYAIWYPVVNRRQVNWFEQKFARSGLRNIQVYELARELDTEGLGMTSSCMLVINPPWRLKGQMETLLPALVPVIERSARGFCRIQQLVEE